MLKICLLLVMCKRVRGQPETELKCETCEGLSFPREDLASRMTDFSRLCFTGCEHALFVAIGVLSTREATLTLAQNRGCGL